MAGARALRRWFCVCVACLAIYQFSENTADPDLWGHVVFGAHLLKTGALMRTDPFAWTAPGWPWINHEVLAEIALAKAYLWLGGTGLLLLKMFVGLLTFGLALSLAIRSMPAATRPVAWAFGALAVVEISFGFAARPQIFSALALAAQFWLVRRVHRGQPLWLLAFPALFALWINTHGGAIAGIVLLWITVAAAAAQRWLRPFAPERILARLDEPLPPATLAWFSIATTASLLALLANPYGAELVRWLVQSVFWTQRGIGEWNPAPLGWDHAAFFFCAALAAAAWVLSRRPVALWEIAVTAVLGVMAFRSTRNTPLFCIAALAFVPPHLADVLQRFRGHFQRFEELGRDARSQKRLTITMMAASAGMVLAAFTLHKERAWTMEAPRSQYPIAAIQFIRDAGLRGKMLTYFDWGELCIWELPGSRVSIDGRLDTCYPPDVIAAHWAFYRGDITDKSVLLMESADYALLPANLPGAFLLAGEFKNSNWQPVYVDNTAVVLVKNPGQYPRLAGLKLPVQGPPSASQGRVAFPWTPKP